MKKTFIVNSAKEKICLVIEQPRDPKGLVFIIHGLGGFKEQAHIKAIKEVFLKAGYVTVRFDARNTIGDSQGQMLEATLTSYFEDLQTVIAWSSKQPWYQEPFVLAGHSLGATCTVLYAKKHQKKVKAIAPLSVFISGKEFEKAMDATEFANWRQTGIKEWESSSRPGVLKKIKWQFMEDAYQYDLLKDAQALDMPTLMAVGSEDKITPLSLQKKFFKKITSKSKQLHIIKGSEHTMCKKSHLAQLKKIMRNWLEEI
ncbi:MAG: alpha/beta fold hydrolase [Candidatus Woesebacteria bacterium]|jgi:alpha-beta hydrolase superfamily lysophospholipase